MSFSVAIRARGISVSFGQTRPLHQVDLDFRPGDYPVVLVGPSGSGKTTLLNVISGDKRPDTGHITIAGSPVETAGWKRPGDPRVVTIYQDYRLIPFLTVAENISLAREIRKDCASMWSSVEDVMSEVGLHAIEPSRMPVTLSGGEQQRVAIARALYSGCSVLLADEPTGALDPENTAMVADLLGRLGEQNAIAVVIATHDPDVANRAGRLFRLETGCLYPE